MEPQSQSNERPVAVTKQPKSNQRATKGQLDRDHRHIKPWNVDCVVFTPRLKILFASVEGFFGSNQLAPIDGLHWNTLGKHFHKRGKGEVTTHSRRIHTKARTPWSIKILRFHPSIQPCLFQIENGGVNRKYQTQSRMQLRANSSFLNECVNLPAMHLCSRSSTAPELLQSCSRVARVLLWLCLRRCCAAVVERVANGSQIALNIKKESPSRHCNQVHVSEQFQSSFRAVSVRFPGIFPAVPQRFKSNGRATFDSKPRQF